MYVENRSSVSHIAHQWRGNKNLTGTAKALAEFAADLDCDNCRICIQFDTEISFGHASIKVECGDVLTGANSLNEYNDHIAEYYDNGNLFVLGFYPYQDSLGVFQNDMDYEYKQNPGKWSSAYCWPITRKEFDSIKSQLLSLRSLQASDLPNYDALSYNCTTFAVDFMRETLRGEFDLGFEISYHRPSIRRRQIRIFGRDIHAHTPGTAAGDFETYFNKFKVPTFYSR